VTALSHGRDTEALRTFGQKKNWNELLTTSSMVRAMNRFNDPQRCSKRLLPSLTVGLLTRKILIDGVAVLFYYHLNTGKEVIEKYMSSYHSEVAET